MSAAASPGPNNILLLAVLGIGAYYLMTRRVMAQPMYQQPQPGMSTADKVGLAGAALGAITGIIGKFSGGGGGSVPLLGTWDGRSAQPWDVTPQGPTGPQYNNPSAYVSGGADGLAFNPVNVSAFDSFGGYALA